jgi:hypothetical protein
MSAFATSAIWHASTSSPENSRERTRRSALARIQHDLAAYFARDRSAGWPPPQRTSQARPTPLQRCGSLQRVEPCDTYEDYGLGVRCIVHGGGFPDAMFPAVYNANMRILQSAGVVAIAYELIHDTRIIPIEAAPRQDRLSENIRMYMGNARGLRLIERFRRTGKDSYACHEGNYGLEQVLRTSRLYDR